MLKQEFTYKKLDNFRRQVVKESRKNAQKNSASGDLAKSITSKLNVSKNSFSLDFLMNEYGNFQDKGVKGAKSSAKAPNSPFKFGSGTGQKGGLRKSLDKWVIRKGIAPRTKEGKFMSRKSLTFLIARSIYRTGLKPTLFFTKPFEKNFAKLPDELITSFGLDVEDFVEFTLKNTFE